MNDVTFSIRGPAAIAGVGNGDHHFPAEFDSDQVALFYGKAMLILRTQDDAAGAIEVAARSQGLVPGLSTLQSAARTSAAGNGREP